MIKNYTNKPQECKGKVLGSARIVLVSFQPENKT